MPFHLINMRPQAMAAFAYNWCVHDFQHDANPFVLGPKSEAAYARWSSVTGFQVASLDIFGGTSDLLSGGGDKNENVQSGGASYEAIYNGVSPGLPGSAADSSGIAMDLLLPMLRRIRMCMSAVALKQYGVTNDMLNRWTREAQQSVDRNEPPPPLQNAASVLFGIIQSHQNRSLTVDGLLSLENADAALRFTQSEFSRLLFYNFNQHIANIRGVSDDPVWKQNGNADKYQQLLMHYITLFNLSDQDSVAYIAKANNSALQLSLSIMILLDKVEYAKLTAAWMRYFSFLVNPAWTAKEPNLKLNIMGHDKVVRQEAINYDNFFEGADLMYEKLSSMLQLRSTCAEFLRQNSLDESYATYDNLLKHFGIICSDFAQQGSVINNRILFLKAFNQIFAIMKKELVPVGQMQQGQVQPLPDVFYRSESPPANANDAVTSAIQNMIDILADPSAKDTSSLYDISPTGVMETNAIPFIINHCLTPFFSEKLAQEVSLYQSIERLTYGDNAAVMPDQEPCHNGHQPAIFYQTGVGGVARGPAVGKVALDRRCKIPNAEHIIIFRQNPSMLFYPSSNGSQSFLFPGPNGQLIQVVTPVSLSGGQVRQIPFNTDNLGEINTTMTAIFTVGGSPPPLPHDYDQEGFWEGLPDDNTRYFRKYIWFMQILNQNQLLSREIFSPLIIDGVRRKYIKYGNASNRNILVWWTHGQYPWEEEAYTPRDKGIIQIAGCEMACYFWREQDFILLGPSKTSVFFDNGDSSTVEGINEYFSNVTLNHSGPGMEQRFGNPYCDYEPDDYQESLSQPPGQGGGSLNADGVRSMKWTWPKYSDVQGYINKLQNRGDGTIVGKKPDGADLAMLIIGFLDRGGAVPRQGSLDFLGWNARTNDILKPKKNMGLFKTGDNYRPVIDYWKEYKDIILGNAPQNEVFNNDTQVDIVYCAPAPTPSLFGSLLQLTELVKNGMENMKTVADPGNPLGNMKNMLSTELFTDRFTVQGGAAAQDIGDIPQHQLYIKIIEQTLAACNVLGTAAAATAPVSPPSVDVTEVVNIIKPPNPPVNVGLMDMFNYRVRFFKSVDDLNRNNKATNSMLGCIKILMVQGRMIFSLFQCVAALLATNPQAERLSLIQTMAANLAPPKTFNSYIQECLVNLKTGFETYLLICDNIANQNKAPKVLSSLAVGLAGFTTCANVVCMHHAFKTLTINGNQLIQQDGTVVPGIPGTKLFEIDYEATKKVLNKPNDQKKVSGIDETAFLGSIAFMDNAVNDGLKWPAKFSKIVNIDNSNEWTLPANGPGNELIIPYNNTIFGAAKAKLQGDQAALGAINNYQVFVTQCFDTSRAFKISNASTIKPTYYGLVGDEAVADELSAARAIYGTGAMSGMAQLPTAADLDRERDARPTNVNKIITFCPTSSIADAAKGMCPSARTAAAGPGLEYGVIHVVMQSAIPAAGGAGAETTAAGRMRIELQSTPYTARGIKCNADDQMPLFVMIRMHVKIGTETVINIGNLQDFAANNEAQDPDPETNGLTAAQQAEAARPVWIKISQPSANPGLPGLKVAMDGGTQPLMASTAISNATASILRVFAGTGKWADFITAITSPTSSARRCRILVNNKSVVKSLGDSIQEINTYAPNGGYVEGPWQTKPPGRQIVPPQAKPGEQGFRWTDCQDQPSAQRGAMAVMYGDNINSDCISSFSSAGKRPGNKRWLRSVLAVRYDGGAQAPPPQAGGKGKTNRKRTIRRRKRRLPKKTKYRNKKNVTSKRKNTKKIVNKKKKKNTKHK